MLRPVALCLGLQALYLGLYAQDLGLYTLYLAYIIFILRMHRRNHDEFIIAISIYHRNQHLSSQLAFIVAISIHRYNHEFIIIIINSSLRRCVRSTQ